MNFSSSTADVLPRVSFDQVLLDSGSVLPLKDFRLTPKGVEDLTPLIRPGHHCIPAHWGADGLSIVTAHGAPGHVKFSLLRGDHVLVMGNVCCNLSASEGVWRHIIAECREPHPLYAAFPHAVSKAVLPMAPMPRPKGLYVAVKMQPGLLFSGKPDGEWLTHFEMLFFYACWINGRESRN